MCAAQLDDAAALERLLTGVRVVLHCAGPFFRTSTPMVAACLSAGAHYLDITGEIIVFETCKARHKDAVAKGIVIMPGVGFDVVPTDCLAARLNEALPAANLLELAFAGGGGFSRGTLETMVLGSPQGGAIRKDGRVSRVPAGWKTQLIPFRDRTRTAVTIPWGDISTAHWSTKIPNIHTYLAVPPRAMRMLRVMRTVSPLLTVPFIRKFVESQIDARVNGPSEAVRASARMRVWGRVTHADRRTREGTAETPEGYRSPQSLRCTARSVCSQRRHQRDITHHRVRSVRPIWSRCRNVMWCCGREVECGLRACVGWGGVRRDSCRHDRPFRDACQRVTPIPAGASDGCRAPASDAPTGIRFAL
jgi:short subunit dehydrogenase-like uncharacterized protein